MLNVDKKPLCGARKQRWLVSVARKEKNPSNGSHSTTTKNNVDDDDKKNQNNFSRRKFFFSVLCDVLRVSLTLYVFERKFFSSAAVCLNEFVYVEENFFLKKSWENKNTRESGKKVWRKLYTNIFCTTSCSDVSSGRKK